MIDFAEEPPRPPRTEYLDATASMAAGRTYKRRFLEALGLSPGQVVLDVGCGPGTDLGSLAQAVGPDGLVLGVDRDPDMVEQARLRTAEYRNVHVHHGDAHALPFEDASIDRARTDRVLQHVERPSQALAELRRVLRPGGILGMAEPDWDTLAIDDRDAETSRAYARFVANYVRNGPIGRQLARLAFENAFDVLDVEASVVLFRDFDSGEQVLGFRRTVARAVRAGAMTLPAATEWLERLPLGPFLASFTLFTVVVRR